MEIRKIGIISKPSKTEALELIKDLLPWFKDRGYDIVLEQETAEEMGLKGVQRAALAKEVDVLVVLGGDGTMLSAARVVAPRDVPILGINLGGLGFITEVNVSEVYTALEKMLKGECSIEERMMLHSEVLRHGDRIAEHTILNDVVITKGALARIIDLETYIDHNYVTTYKADGLILSTPTGSTAYNLSAGGPILHPSLDCIIMTPICPHTLTNRPLVIPGESMVEVSLISDSEDVFLTLDGQVGMSLRKGDIVQVKKSPHKTKLLVPCEKDYYQVLREKLNWGKR
jgi:NAD+ kinase